MTRAIAHTYNFAIEYRSTITASLIFTVLFMSFLYAVNVYAIVSRSVALQQIEKQVTAAEMEVRSLDMSYLGLSKKISPDALSAYGMTQGNPTAFIQRTTSLGRAVSSQGGL